MTTRADAPVIAATAVAAGHDGRAELVLELAYPNGARTHLSVTEEADRPRARRCGLAVPRRSRRPTVDRAVRSRSDHYLDRWESSDARRHHPRREDRRWLGLARLPRRRRHQGRSHRVGRPAAGRRRESHRRDGQGRDARLHRSAHALRRADLLRPVRVSRDRARHHVGRHRQLLAEPRSGAGAAARPLRADVPAHRGDARSRVRPGGRLALGRVVRRDARRAEGEPRVERRAVGGAFGAAARRARRGRATARDDRRGRGHVRPAARVPRGRRRRHVDELRRHRGGLQPGAVPLGRAQRARGAVLRCSASTAACCRSSTSSSTLV